ncbi:MAG: peptide chain release factor 3 [Candidatus Hydrogenedentales bacterium]|jgi:peptide chain release factor 3
MPSSDRHFLSEIARRRTFAIVSHPDAGKTTLTEKLLLYGGAVGLAGSVTARKNQRATTSDWLELEQKRGISISSTVLNFDYHNYRINLLDTPGHHDFSEDTYRVLTAVDAAIMVIDAGKGIESQTQKLFEVCRLRGIPIFTFINKMDRPSREPLELLDEIESILKIRACPMNWPLGAGVDFKGVWDRYSKAAHLFERTPGGAYRAPVRSGGLSDPQIRGKLSDHVYNTAHEEIEMLEAAGTAFDPKDVLSAETTPVYFGSALNNFGIELLLDGFLKYSSPPTPRKTVDAKIVTPNTSSFSGFVFKIQANMNPHHRDRVAFVRIVSGKFERNMSVTHIRTGKNIRLSNVSKVFGSDRETVDEGYPGDVIGIVGTGAFAIGDTLAESTSIEYDEIPYFAPECFCFLENYVAAQAKRFRTGLGQLLQEGVVQAYEVPDAARKVPLLGAAGPLQFEIVQYRLQQEYGAESHVEMAPWTIARWLDPQVSPSSLSLPSGVRHALDGRGRSVLLFSDRWRLIRFSELNPNLALESVPFDHASMHVLRSREALMAAE